MVESGAWPWALSELRRVDRRGSAFGAMRRSRELAEMCGAPHTPARATAEAPPEFTGREREVIMLAGKGLINRAIAERPHLSIRTAEGHLYAPRAGSVHVIATNSQELSATTWEIPDEPANLDSIQPRLRGRTLPVRPMRAGGKKRGLK